MSELLLAVENENAEDVESILNKGQCTLEQINKSLKMAHRLKLKRIIEIFREHGQTLTDDTGKCDILIMAIIINRN